MSRQERFTFLCNENERLMIANLADWLQRTQSDAVRFVIREAVEFLRSRDNVRLQNSNPEVQNE